MKPDEAAARLEELARARCRMNVPDPLTLAVAVAAGRNDANAREWLKTSLALASLDGPDEE